MSRAEIIQRGDDAEAFDALVAAAALPDLDRQELGFRRLYYPAVRGDGMTDASFAVSIAGRPVCFALCDVTAGLLANVHHGITPHFVAGLDGQQRAGAVKAIFDWLDTLPRRLPIDRTWVMEWGADGTVSDMGLASLARKALPSLYAWAIADLSVDEAEVASRVRRRYKSMINWGRRNLTLDYVNGDNPDRSLYDAFHHFHDAVAGRKTRSQASWDAGFDWIQQGNAELTLGYLEDGTLVAASLFRDGDTRSYYTSAAYDRTRFEKPLSHWPVFDAMLRAKTRGKTSCDLGWVPAFGTVDDKEYQIGQFKKGLAGQLRTSTEWTWQSGQSARVDPEVEERRTA